MSYPYLSPNLETKDPRKITPGLKWSLIGHSVIFLFVILKSLLFPSKVTPYIPTLKVDLVALPDVLKKDLVHPSQSQFNKEISNLLKKVEKESHKSVSNSLPHPPQKNDSKNSPKPSKNEMTLGSKGKSEKVIEKRNLRALERIKALSKIQTSDDDSPKAHQARPIAGNKISPGTSLSGEAKEALEANYYDILRDRLNENWTLPPWVARQNLSAQVLLLIDSRGRLREFRIKKPSGNVQFDDAVKRAIQESQPFPAPPKELASSLISDGILVGFPL